MFIGAASVDAPVIAEGVSTTLAFGWSHPHTTVSAQSVAQNSLMTSLINKVFELLGVAFSVVI